VVSEETGRIALSRRGELYSQHDPPKLRDQLRDLTAARTSSEPEAESDEATAESDDKPASDTARATTPS